MAEILLDSDVIIAWLRGYDPFVKRIAGLLESDTTIHWCPISIAEIFAGARAGEQEATENLFLVLEATPVSAAAGRKAGDYLHTYRKSHGVELGDALVAACAFTQRLALWTLNRRHYPMQDIEFFS